MSQKPTPRAGRWGILVSKKWVTFATKEEAAAESMRLEMERKKSRLEIQLGGNHIAQRGDLLVVANRYLTNLKAGNRRPSYIKKNKRYLDKLCNLNIERVDGITPNQIEKILETMEGKTQDANAFTRTAKIFLKWCRDVGGYKIDDRVLRVKNPTIDEKQQRLLSEDEVRQILKATEKPEYCNHLMVDFLKAFGPRPAEFCALTDENLNEITATLTIPGTISKTRQPRVFVIGRAWVDKIKKGQTKRKEGCKNIFVNAWGSPWNWTYIRNIIKRAADSCKLGRVNAYLFRHYAACKIFELTKDPKIVETIIGHDWQTSLKYYQHRDKATMTKLADQL